MLLSFGGAPGWRSEGSWLTELTIWERQKPNTLIPIQWRKLCPCWFRNTEEVGVFLGVLLPYTTPGLRLEEVLCRWERWQGKGNNKNSWSKVAGSSLGFLQQNILNWGGAGNKASGWQVARDLVPKLNKNLGLLWIRTSVWQGPGLPGCENHGADPKLKCCIRLKNPLVMPPPSLGILSTLCVIPNLCLKP